MIRTASFALMLLLAACGKNPGSYTTATETEGATADEQLMSEADGLWEDRADEGKLQDALAKYEAIVAADPTNRKALIRLTRGWYFWGDAFSDDKDTKVERWTRSIEWGKRCIALNSEVADQINQGAKEKDAIQSAQRPDAGCIYWTATALGKWGKIQSLSKTLKHLPTVKAYVAKVEELDPSYYHYGPARYWAAYYAALPSFAGQDMDKSAEYFEAAIEAAPYYLPTRVLRAEYLAVGVQDANMFAQDLHHVLNADPNDKPEAGITAENVRELNKARGLWERRNELFDKDEMATAEAALPKVVTKPRPEPAPEVTKPEPTEETEVKEVSKPETEGEEAKTVEKPE